MPLQEYSKPVTDLGRDDLGSQFTKTTNSVDYPPESVIYTISSITHERTSVSLGVHSRLVGQDRIAYQVRDGHEPEILTLERWVDDES